MNAGKDVYCEKPMVQRFQEGRDVSRRRKAHRPHPAGGQPTRQLHRLPEGERTARRRRHRRIEHGGSLGGPQLRHRRLAVLHSAGRLARQHRLGPLPGPRAQSPFEPVRLFRWRNYRDYGTGVAGDLFVHLFSGIHFVTGAIGPNRVYATGGLRFWKDGRDVPDVMIALYDYPPSTRLQPDAARQFRGWRDRNLRLRFIGSEGIMTIDSGVTLSKVPREIEPGYTIDTFPKAMQEQFLKEYRQKYPARPNADCHPARGRRKVRAAQGYSDHFEHHRNFIAAVRSRKPVVEDAVFGFRAAGPALLSNISYFEQPL